MSPLGPFNEFYINKDDPFLADDFVIKNSFQDIRKREYENITATWDEIGKTLTSASLDIEDDALNNGLVFLQDDNGDRQIVEITASALAGNITIDPLLGYFGDMTANLTDAADYIITIGSRKRYIGETEEKILDPAVEYASVFTRVAPRIKWLTYEVGSDPQETYNIKSNKKSLDLILFKMVQQGTSDWHVEIPDAIRPTYISIIRDITTTGAQVRTWLLPRTQFRNANPKNLEATEGSEIVRAIVMDILRDSILTTDKMVKIVDPI